MIDIQNELRRAMILIDPVRIEDDAFVMCGLSDQGVATVSLYYFGYSDYSGDDSFLSKELCYVNYRPTRDDWNIAQLLAKRLGSELDVPVEFFNGNECDGDIYIVSIGTSGRVVATTSLDPEVYSDKKDVQRVMNQLRRDGVKSVRRLNRTDFVLLLNQDCKERSKDWCFDKLDNMEAILDV